MPDLLIFLCAHILHLSLQTLTGFASFKAAGLPLPEKVAFRVVEAEQLEVAGERAREERPNEKAKKF